MKVLDESDILTLKALFQKDVRYVNPVFQPGNYNLLDELLDTEAV